LNGLRNYKLYIDDIRQAAESISKYIEGLSKEKFQEDAKTRDSVLHNLMIIGEAAAKIPDNVREKNPDINWSGIIGMRNIIVHGYFAIDSEIIWITVKEKVPELMKMIDRIV
jgi:uncharacterized protein with HEPN domain